jgi:prepilin-type N-terminal cleavage/methylation domain-containing protein
MIESSLRAPQPRAGLTLVELLVVITILGMSFGVAGLAFRGVAFEPPLDGNSLLRAARREAVRKGESIVIFLEDSAGGRPAFALPDGSIVGGGSLGFARLTGRARNAAR